MSKCSVNFVSIGGVGFVESDDDSGAQHQHWLHPTLTVLQEQSDGTWQMIALVTCKANVNSRSVSKAMPNTPLNSDYRSSRSYEFVQFEVNFTEQELAAFVETVQEFALTKKSHAM